MSDPMIERPGLGWIPDLPDVRDLSFAAAAPFADLPPSVDLRPGMPPVGNQGRIGSCTAWAASAAYRYLLLREGKPDFDPAELALYFWSRETINSTRSDSGATIRDAIKVMAKRGLAPEESWPYVEANIFRKPTKAVQQAAEQHQAIQYEAVPQRLEAMMAALAEGLPIVLGISVYSSLYSAETTRTGRVQLPAADDRLEGGHAILVCGYGLGETGDLWAFRNSWGTGWSSESDHPGYGYLPGEYLASRRLASDFWVVRSCEG